jgi:hypothetical protein
MTRGQWLRGQRITLGHMEGAHMNRSLDFGGCALYFPISGFCNYIIKILIDFSASFERFWPLLEDLELFLKPDLGGKLGVCFQLQAYINQRFLSALEKFGRGEMMKNCKAKAIFMQGSH